MFLKNTEAIISVKDTAVHRPLRRHGNFRAVGHFLSSAMWSSYPVQGSGPIPSREWTEPSSPCFGELQKGKGGKKHDYPGGYYKQAHVWPLPKRGFKERQASIQKYTCFRKHLNISLRHRAKETLRRYRIQERSWRYSFSLPRQTQRVRITHSFASLGIYYSKWMQIILTPAFSLCLRKRQAGVTLANLAFGSQDRHGRGGGGGGPCSRWPPFQIKARGWIFTNVKIQAHGLFKGIIPRWVCQQNSGVTWRVIR